MIYRCRHCEKMVWRKGSKHWMKSYCEETGKNVHLMLIPKNQYKKYGIDSEKIK